jgi:glutamine synthetase
VAAAVLEWAIEKDASSYCHWFQPLASNGLRHGQAAQVQIKLYEFDRSGQSPKYLHDHPQ